MTAAELAPHLNLAPDLNALIWEADPETFQFTYVSRGAERLLGYPLEQWLTRQNFWVEMLHPEDRDTAVAFCQQAVKDGRDHEFEYRAVAADGRVLWIRDIVCVTRDAADRTIALRGVMLDVTARKTDESVLRRHDTYMRELVAQTPDIITFLTRGGQVIYDSPSVEHVMGYKPETRVGRGAWDEVHPDDVPQTLETFERLFVSGEPAARIQFRYRHANGMWRTLEAVGRAFTDETGQLIAIINSRDITERVVLEEAARHTQKMEALGRLTTSIAHDFNRLLRIIVGNTNQALVSEFGVARRLQLLEIQRAAEVGVELTRQLSDFGDEDGRSI